MPTWRRSSPRPSIASSLARFVTEEHWRLCGEQPLLPGVRDRLLEARALGFAAAVASSSPSAWVQPWLDTHDLMPLLQAVCTRDDVARVKPEPDLFLKAAERLGVPPAECIVFEDSPNGIRAAHAAGMRVVAIPNALTAAPGAARSAPDARVARGDDAAGHCRAAGGPDMRVHLQYGTDGLAVDLPDDGVTVIAPRYVDGLADEAEAFRAAVRRPIDSPPLAALVEPGERVAIVIPDITRPLPTARLLPVGARPSSRRCRTRTS